MEAALAQKAFGGEAEAVEDRELFKWWTRII
jgi:hypothetical protein